MSDPTLSPPPVGPLSAAELERVVAWRSNLHRHPELSYAERGTTRFIATTLEAMGWEPQFFEATTGVWCDIPARAAGGPHAGEAGGRIALRADIDALPITERSGSEHPSEVAGVAHACGHDMHTAILLGVAQSFGHRLPRVPVRLIFQPAEETIPGGAKGLVEAGVVDGVEQIFALHCEPALPVGVVATTVGPISSSNAEVTVTLRGEGGHTARPYLTQDVIFAAAQVISGTAAVLDRRWDSRWATVLTWGSIHGGAVANAIPAEVTLQGTVRSASREAWQAAEGVLRAAITQIVAPFGVRAEIGFVQGVPPVVNAADPTARLRAAAGAALGAERVLEAAQSTGGEDFAWYLERVPGAYLRLGVWDGELPQVDLHDARFRADDRAIAVGVAVLAGVAEE